MNDKKLLSIYLKICMSVLYIFVLTTLPDHWFRDRVNYEVIAESSRGYFENLSLDILIREPIFLGLNYFLALIFDYDVIPYIFVFIIVCFLTTYLYKRSNNLLMFVLGLCAFLLIPFIFHMQLVVLRQGLATVALIYLVLNVKNDINLLILSCFLFFIHNSFIIYPFIFISYIYLKKINNNILFISSIVSLSIFLVYGVAVLLLDSFGFYQLSYQNLNEVEVGGFSFLFISLILFIYYFFVYNKNERIHELTFIFFTIYLVMYFVTPLIGRYVITFMPFLVLSLVDRSRGAHYLILIFIILVYGYVSFTGSLSENSLMVKPFWE